VARLADVQADGLVRCVGRRFAEQRGAGRADCAASIAVKAA